MIEVKNYTKNYKEVMAVEDLSFDVLPGQIMGMVGPNGAGKTTTMKALAGIITPTHGILKIDGHDVVKNPIDAKRSIAMIPDEPRLFESLTVWEHLQFTASTYKIRNFEAEAERLLDQFELLPKRDALAQELSRGMRQKVAICCSYLYQPRAILFDEPHTGLDPHGIRTMRSTVHKRAENGAAIIISSHLLSLIEDMCTHLLIMHKGKSLYCGSINDAKQLYPELGEGTTLEEVFFHATTTKLDQQTLESTDTMRMSNGTLDDTA